MKRNYQPIEAKIMNELGTTRRSVRMQAALEQLNRWKNRLGYYPNFEIIRSSDYWYGSRKNRNKDYDYTIIGADTFGSGHKYYVWLVIKPNKRLELNPAN